MSQLHAAPGAVIARLAETGLTLASAESVTGGELAALLTSVAGSSAAYVGGAVTYATRLKIEMLGIDPSVVEQRGVVSREVAESMATGVRHRLGADLGVATTGVAGPGPQDGVEAGTAWVAVAWPGEVRSELLRTSGSRAHVQAQACVLALDLVMSVVDGMVHPGGEPSTDDLGGEDSPVG